MKATTASSILYFKISCQCLLAEHSKWTQFNKNLFFIFFRSTDTQPSTGGGRDTGNPPGETGEGRVSSATLNQGKLR